MITFPSPGIIAGPRLGAGAPTYAGTITVPAGEVTADLTGFPVMVDMASLPAGFWSEVASDGGDVRMFDGVTPIACDVVTINTGASTGLMFFRAPTLLSASPRAFTIETGSGLAKPADGDAIGRNAVWSGFHRMYAWQEPGAPDRTGNGFNGYPWVEANYRWSTFSTTAALTGGSGHVQGVAWDGTHYYVTWTNTLQKYNSSWGLVASVANPISSAGLSGLGVDHVGGIEVQGGLLYIAMEDIDTGAPGLSADQHIAVFDAATLAHVTNYDISAQDKTIADIAYRASDNCLYVIDYFTWSLDVYSLTGVYQRTLTLSQPFTLGQGCTFMGDRLFLCGGDTAGYTREVDPDTGMVLRLVQRQTFCQGLGTNGARFLQPDTTNVIRTIDDYVGGTMSGGIAGWYNHDDAANGFAGGQDLSQLTVWTAGASVRFNSLSKNRTVFAYTDSGFTSSAFRETAVYRQSTNRLSGWNSTDTWMSDTVAPSTGVIYRMNIAKDGTTERRLYKDGALVATDTGTAARPGNGPPNALLVGAGDVGYSEMLNGSANYLYVYAGILSADWLAAEASNWLNPSGFYTVTP